MKERNNFKLVLPIIVLAIAILISEFIPDKFAFYKILLLNILHSLKTLVAGYSLGTILGLITGIVIGWNPKLNYWFSFFRGVIGMVLAIAWLPITITLFSNNSNVSIVILTLAAWLPITIMTSSGISSVPKCYFEAAQTLGADKSYQIFKVALPYTLPNIFTGMFTGLGICFVTLIVPEMIRVNLDGALSERIKAYASLIIMSMFFSMIITMLFKVRNKMLIWKRGSAR